MYLWGGGAVLFNKVLWISWNGGDGGGGGVIEAALALFRILNFNQVSMGPFSLWWCAGAKDRIITN